MVGPDNHIWTLPCPVTTTTTILVYNTKPDGQQNRRLIPWYLVNTLFGIWDYFQPNPEMGLFNHNTKVGLFFLKDNVSYIDA